MAAHRNSLLVVAKAARPLCRALIRLRALSTKVLRPARVQSPHFSKKAPARRLPATARKRTRIASAAILLPIVKLAPALSYVWQFFVGFGPEIFLTVFITALLAQVAFSLQTGQKNDNLPSSDSDEAYEFVRGGAKISRYTNSARATNLAQ